MRPAVATPARIGLTLAVFLATLVLVAWRQTRAYAVMSEIERVNAEIALAKAEADDLRQRIQYLESLERVAVDARDRLGMHLPSDTERVILGEAVQ